MGGQKQSMTGKQFRQTIGKKNIPVRVVDPFSIKSLQQNTVVRPPPKFDNFKWRVPKTSLFRKYFKRGDIPIAKTMNKPEDNPETLLQWKIPPKDLDYTYYLPIFFEGLCENDREMKALARSGVDDLLKHGGDKILATIPHLIIPIKKALNTRVPDIIVATLKALQNLVKSGPCVGESLVPYYRQILPICNLFRDVERDNVDDTIEETLQLLEEYGGPDAYINIKYMVPTYESSVQN